MENKGLYTTLTGEETILKNITPDAFIFNSSNQEVLLEIRKTNNEEMNDSWSIKFNKDKFPQYKSDDFAREFIDILEKHIIRRNLNS